MTDAAARYERERAFHDDRFSSEARPADAFYTVNAACNEHYDTLLAAIPAGSRVLEYGCGLGSAAFDLAARGVEVTAIDLSAVAVREAEAHASRMGLESVTFVQMNAEALAYSDGAFDVVCGSGILHHLDLDLALREVSRVLGPGGRAVFIEPLGHNPLVNLYRRFTPDQRTDDEHPLLAADLERFSRSFRTSRNRSFALLALLALPLRSSSHLDRVLRSLDRADRWLFRRVRWSRRFAWTVVLEGVDPVSAPRLSD
jgi:SAM-dependent methyltransferase